ncbi:hypothetical protein TNIN_428271 [Trichonephila inaurata madagascariensis]|uniref:Uncharacterized protein n=1 Tax=Trichonephila inaurata madagascariensis TaxID=2747483 RepID=A0A8X6YLX2_9ARAC|nr:hypothetical protein TNIN_428271 [Trichonephila inaurata madagascariensis]
MRGDTICYQNNLSPASRMLNYSEMISRTKLSEVLKSRHIRNSYRVDCMGDSLLKASSFTIKCDGGHLLLRTPANLRNPSR